MRGRHRHGARWVRLRRWHRHMQKKGLWPMVLTWQLHRRIFWWIAGTILLTAVVVGLTTHLIARTAGMSSWQRVATVGQRMVADRFAESWDDPARRGKLLRELSSQMELRAELDGPDGTTLDLVGEPCHRAMFELPVMRDGQTLGKIRACDATTSGPWRAALPVMAAVLVLWAVAGKLARRMMRPLYIVLDVADRLGKGDLKARAKPPRHRHSDERTLARALNRMADRIERQMANQRELLAQVSHELRTPLGHMRLLLEMGREKPDVKTLDEMEKELVEIDALVADLLASSRVSFEALNLRDLDASELAARALERAGIGADKLKVDGAPRIHADATLVVRALANLLDNAKAHGNGVALLEVKREGEQVRFAVIDAGPGFEPGDVERAFDPFFHRPRGADGDGGSLGLGLALVQRIARAHGGEASARNRDGGGAEVSFVVRAAA